MQKENAMQIQDGEPENVRIAAMKDEVEQYIKKHYAEDISIYKLASMMNYSEAYFCKLFKRCFNVNFTTYLLEYRMEIAKKLLEDPKINIKVIGKSCGYPDSNYFTRVFKRSIGMTPTEYRTKVMLEKWTESSYES